MRALAEFAILSTLHSIWQFSTFRNSLTNLLTKYGSSTKEIVYLVPKSTDPSASITASN